MSELILVRHGETVWDNSRFSSYEDDYLSPEGHAQIRRAENFLRTHQIDIAYTSQNVSARLTAQGIYYRRTNPVPKLSLQKLNGRDFGEYAGRVRADIVNELGQKSYNALFNDRSARPPHGESIDDVSRRVEDVYRSNICRELQLGHGVLVVAQHDPIVELARIVEGGSLNKEIEIANGDARVYGYKAGTFELSAVFSAQRAAA